jgi:hypothetical protein
MALTLYVDTARWRAHHKHVSEQFPGLVPVCKGNGYGFGHERLADEATRLGSDMSSPSARRTKPRGSRTGSAAICWC